MTVRDLAAVFGRIRDVVIGEMMVWWSGAYWGVLGWEVVGWLKVGRGEMEEL